MSFLVRRFAAALVISALLAPASHAQELPMSERQKADIERRKAEEKANDEAYKATVKRTPSVKQKTDPWSTMRTPPGSANK